MIHLTELTIAKARKSLDSGEFTAVELAQAYLEAIKEKNGEIFAYLEVFDDVLEQAKRADEMIKTGKGSPMTGIPMAIKDNMLIEGKESTSASKILKGHIGTYDATVIAKLKTAGAVFLGRTNMDEFAMGSSTETSAYGKTKNPRDTARVPGGSSGGSAAAVASDMALVALGSDTGGSIRQPAAFCGIVGMKPSYGAVSRFGLMAMASSLDQIGPFTKTVEDAEIVFEAIRGCDPLDSTTIPENLVLKNKKTTWIPAQGRNDGSEAKKIKIGIPRDFLSMKGLDPRVLENFEDTIKKLEAKGYEIVDVSLPYMKYSLATYYIIMPAEVSSNLARFDGVRFGLSVQGADVSDSYKKTRAQGFGEEVRRRILLGAYVLSAGYADAYYRNALKARKLIRKDFERVFKEVDLIATPTTPSPAFKIGEKMNDPLQMYLADIFTVPANMAELPAISVPSGTVEEEGKQLPLGFHLIAPYFGEEILFKVGREIS
ncbi:MAG: Asp-tRNA(Asn)/Glu-tRNA(Gln) amidotransferase subunit GatA [Candidatus Parcubacteria bacterium]|nr:Asp-tRNA(Asn)/Glu-tRNA(Gln) amidotransferase subunit GatA [Candidatus Parcubacteria bacterium]